MGGKTTTSTNKVTIPQDVLDRYNAVNTQAAKVAENPFQKYGTTQEDFVAQFNEQQLKGVQGINDVAGMGAVYENVDKYLNPYTKNVADTTRAQLEQANEQAQSGALGTAVQSGAFGGDRAGVAAANLSNQQNLAMGSTMANIYNQGYTQAIDTSMNDRNRMLGVAGAQLGAGTQMQQTEQAGIDALINQFQQEQGYPFQVAQFLANIAMGTGALSGSTTTTTQPAPAFSDRRLKHDIKKIGEADNGLPIYTFKYKGDEHHQTHVGFMADEVEKTNPDAVGLDPSGYKTVDYDKAAQSMGGGVNAGRSGEGYADGGVAGPYSTTVGQGVGTGSYVPQAYLPVGELMMADPATAAQSQSNFLDTINSAATAGSSVLEFRDKLRELNANKKAYGGVAGGYAGGGGVEPQVHDDYLSSTLAAQEAGKDKKELMTAGQQSGQQGSALGNIASTIGSVATIAQALPIIFSDRRLKHDIKRIGKTEKGLPIYTFKYKGDNREQTHVGFMADEVERDHPEAVGKRDGYKTVDYSQAHKFADGGAAGRHGYALDGAVEERIRDAMRKAAAAESNLRLTRDEIPAVQNLGDLPDARVVAAEAPVGVAPEKYIGPKTRGEGYIGPNSRGEAASYYLGLNKPTSNQMDDLFVSQGMTKAIENLLPPRPTAVAAEAPTGVVPEAENDTTVPEYLSDLRIPLRMGAALSGPLNVLAAGGAGLAGLGLGIAGFPDAGNQAIDFAGNRVNDWLDASSVVLGTDKGIEEVYREAAARDAAAENDAANRAVAEAPLTVDQRPKPRPVVGGVAPEKYIGPNSRSEAADYYLGLNKPTDDQLLDVLISQGLTEPGDNLLPPAPTGVVPVSAPVDGQMRPKPRPEGLGAAAAPVVPAKPAADTRRKIASVIGSGDGFTDVVYTDGTKDRVTGNLNFRNNNPGNMEYGDLAKKYGAVGTDGRFAVFPDYETGRKAQEALLFNSGVYEGKTIGSAIAKYAPLGDGNNDPVAYANNVAAALGVPVDTPLSALNPEQRNAMLTAMEKQEGGGGLSTFSTTPLGADGSPVPLRGGVAGGAGGEGRRGGVKPYEDRNALGKMMYDEDGKMNKNALLSLLAGFGDMVSSPSPFLLPAIGAGVAGAARTYMAREEQLADIAQKQAETNQTEVATDVSRFFSAIPGSDGFPLVIIGPGKAITLTEFLKNPVEFSTGDEGRDAAILQEAQRIAGEGGANTPSGGPQGAPSGVRWSDASNEAVQKAIDKLENRPGDFSSNDKESRLIMEGASQARSAALANKPNSNELAFTVSSAIGANNMGTAEGYLSSTFLPVLNAALRSVDPSLEISDADDQQQILRKLSRLSAANMTPEEQRAASVFQEFVSVSPDLRMTPEAAATITASMMLQDQDAIDRANYYSAFMSRAGSGVTMSDVDAAYANEYSEMHQIEKDAMKQLLLLSGDRDKGGTVRDFFSAINSGSANQADAQAVLSYILGEENTPPLLARWLIKGM
tara:strand:- start:100 stop:4542 length:4443 start_codon:yes stop_codon:yes gene_type:complete